MTLNSKWCQVLLKKYLLSIALLFFVSAVFSQKRNADSLSKLLKTETTDTGRVRLMWTLANVMNKYDPDSALTIAQEGVYLARKIKDQEGESRSLGVLAQTFRTIGNYPRALEFLIQKLKLEEKRNKPRNLSSALMNIGIVYVFQEEYRKALEYYWKADSVMNQFDVKDLRYNITLNLGDVFDRLGVSDSALIYFNKSLELANKPEDYQAKKPDDYKIGKSLTGLGHSYRKLGSFQQSLKNYQEGIRYLQAANDDETYCEAALGLAKLYQQMQKQDSAGYYANQSLLVAKKDGLLPLELEAAEFLAKHYNDKGSRNIDSAFAYMSLVHDLNDSVNSISQVRQLQIISSNEQFRQRALEESRRLAKIERSQQLQLLLIAIFIPGLFLLTLFLSRVKLHLQAIRLLGVLSLLFFFEYLTLLLHPTVANLTHHTPVYEILIFVVLAAILIPAHHRLEHWLIHKLIHHRIQHTEKVIKEEVKSVDKKKSPA
jgi:tetratricopeptide (TPR) repeat protein